ALGASRRRILAMVALQGAVQAVAGLIVGGLLLALLRAQGILQLPLDGGGLRQLGLAVALLLLISALAVVVPARKAARLMPSEALRDT
ncbi:MAG: hypothetical protein KDD47_09775, partial [Acidobacteria bacterium]|nr:hypothetical protein [Acidobacteriota bacterium]